ncbi:MAG: Sec-independent protein translocase subunit TatA/TatB [Planctomycetota bacterium]|jgi:sec-independent protein translocase protein TatA
MDLSAADIFSVLGIFGLPGGGEWIILLILGLLIFGRRLPEVGRSIGKSIVEFKRGIKDIETDVEAESSRTAPPKLTEVDSKNLPGTGAAQTEAGQRVGSTPRADASS